MTRSVGQERLTWLCSVTGSPVPFMNKGKRVDKAGKKYVQVIPSCWKPEKILTVNHIPKVRERKLWSGKKVSIPAESSKIVKIRVEGDWRGEGFVKSMSPEEFI